MLPERLLPASFVGDRIVPSYLDATDLPWIAVLLDEMTRFIGRPERELDERLALPLPCSTPPFKLRATLACLRKRWQPEVNAAVDPARAREALFLAAASDPCASRDELVREVASALGISLADLEHAVIADLPGERRVRTPARVPVAQEVVQSVNESIVRGLLARAQWVSVRADGSVRAIVRQAKLARLLCTLREDPDGPVLEISGPFSLFRHTRLYGRALGSLLGRLPYCARFELVGSCVVRGRRGSFTLRSDDLAFHLTPGPEPRAHDSKVELRFARDLRKAAPDWDLVREPEAIVVGAGLFFPDFALTHRLDPRRRFLVEIVGFWTDDYLIKKLAAIRESQRRDLIVCVDETLKCGETDLPAQLDVVRYRRSIDVERVLATIHARCAQRDRQSVEAADRDASAGSLSRR